MKENERVAATITIRRASEMTDRGRRAVASWIQDQALTLLGQAEQLSSRYTAKFRYRERIK